MVILRSTQMQAAGACSQSFPLSVVTEAKDVMSHRVGKTEFTVACPFSLNHKEKACVRMNIADGLMHDALVLSSGAVVDPSKKEPARAHHVSSARGDALSDETWSEELLVRRSLATVCQTLVSLAGDHSSYCSYTHGLILGTYCVLGHQA